MQCAGRIFDASKKSEPVLGTASPKASEKKGLTRVFTQTDPLSQMDHNTQEPLDVGTPSPTLDNWWAHSNELIESMAGDTDADAVAYQHPSEQLVEQL